MMIGSLQNLIYNFKIKVRLLANFLESVDKEKIIAKMKLALIYLEC